MLSVPNNIFKITNRIPLQQSDRKVVSKVADIVLQGGVAGVPTETVYGICCKAENENGIKSLYRIKKRQKAKPIALCLADVSQIRKFGQCSHIPDFVFNALLPGPVTILLKRTENVPKELNPGVESVGIRVPNCEFIRLLCQKVGPIALTSANLSSQKSSIAIDEFKKLWPQLNAVVDQGVLGSRQASTVVDLSQDRNNKFRIVREGMAADGVRYILQNVLKMTEYIPEKKTPTKEFFNKQIIRSDE